MMIQQVGTGRKKSTVHNQKKKGIVCSVQKFCHKTRPRATELSLLTKPTHQLHSHAEDLWKHRNLIILVNCVCCFGRRKSPKKNSMEYLDRTDRKFAHRKAPLCLVRVGLAVHLCELTSFNAKYSSMYT